MSVYKRVLNSVLGDDLVSKIITVCGILGVVFIAFFYIYIKNLDCSNICEEDILFAIFCEMGWFNFNLLLCGFFDYLAYLAV